MSKLVGINISQVFFSPSRLYFLALIIFPISLPCSAQAALYENEHCGSERLQNAQTDVHFELKRITSNGKIEEDENSAFFTASNEGDVYILRFALAEPIILSDMIEFILFIDGWERIKYFAYGYEDEEGKFWHYKATNPVQGKIFSDYISKNSPLFWLGNNYTEPESKKPIKAKSFKFFMKGLPSDTKAIIKLLGIRNHSYDFYNQFYVKKPNDCWKLIDLELPTSVDTHSLDVKPNKALNHYLKLQNPSYSQDAKTNVRGSRLALSAIQEMDWPDRSMPPEKVQKYTTARFLWHALNPIVTALIAYEEDRDEEYLNFSKKFFENWYKNNWATEPVDKRFAWYDHGVSLRQLALLKLLEHIDETTYSSHTSHRLAQVIHQQASVIASEAFYARNQLTRSHNHAIFQDIALLMSAEMLPQHMHSERWKKIATKRIKSQFEELSIAEDGARINLENSLGYHRGMHSACDLVESLAREALPQDDFCNRFGKFTKLISYLDGRGPSYGDSYRIPNNPEIVDQVKNMHLDKPLFNVFSTAGVATIRDSFEGGILQYSMIATNKTKIHKHEDNLSLSLWASGIEFLIDPGFYNHHYLNPIPAYARSAMAHNNMGIREKSLLAGCRES